jgi:inosine-uridine nucleoside N-ribohydrolase
VFLSAVEMDNSVPRNVVIDVDVGSDDAWAVLMLLKFEKKFNFKVQAITCVHGNTTVRNVAKNLIRVLKTINRLDIPIFMGADEMLIPQELARETQFHGSNGFGDYQFEDEIQLEGVVQKDHAVIAMKHILEQFENVSLICVGPLTNLALLLKMYPDVKSRISRTYIMGGNRNGENRFRYLLGISDTEL